MTLVGAMDISYDPKCEHAFMAIVIGKKDSINHLYKNLGFAKIHMSQMANKKKQKDIVSKIKFDGKNSIAFCIKINHNINKIIDMNIIQKKRISRGKIFREHSRLLLFSIRDSLEKFSLMHNCPLTDIPFQCDNDCRGFTKDTGLPYDDPGIAHELSDFVAWNNKNHIVIDGVVELDRLHDTDQKLVERLRK